MEEKKHVLAAKWTDDCSGKKDYDGTILSISSRYWPRGGGFLTWNPRTGEFNGNETRPKISPSAVSTLCLHSTDEDGDEVMVDIEKKSFKAETPLEVFDMVESWAKEMMDRAIRAIYSEFK